MKHTLKIHPEPFAAVLSGAKTYEVRRADREYAVGDEALLREWVPPMAGVTLEGRYTGRELLVRITHLTPAGAWRLLSDVCVWGFERVDVVDHEMHLENLAAKLRAEMERLRVELDRVASECFVLLNAARFAEQRAIPNSESATLLREAIAKAEGRHG